MIKRLKSASSNKVYGIDTTVRDGRAHNTGLSPGNDEIIENVLILQGGGSLGAFGCGVFKALSQNNVKIDIVAGTSIGGVNAAIIAGNKNEKHPEQLLEEFWLELADSFIDIDNSFSFYLTIEKLIANFYFHDSPLLYDNTNRLTRQMQQYRNKSAMSFLSSATLGNDKMFKPRWMPEYSLTDPQYFEPAKWTYLYDHSPLSKTIEKFIDYDKLRPNGNPNSRLIMTAVNVLTSEPLVFDSFIQQITPRHILATCGYPSYNFPWVEVDEGVYAWDGGLLSNT
ncbi:MAG: patatin-like phospholipase family protein, partial [Nitrososphaeraceae archaeon]